MIPITTLYLLLISTYGLNPQDAAIMTCIANEESKLVVTATHINNNGTQDTGLFQINDVNLKLCNMTKKDLMDPKNNIKCAMKVLEEQDFEAWATLRKCVK
jgi:hypothetical protein